MSDTKKSPQAQERIGVRDIHWKSDGSGERNWASSPRRHWLQSWQAVMQVQMLQRGGGFLLGTLTPQWWVEEEDVAKTERRVV